MKNNFLICLILAVLGALLKLLLSASGKEQLAHLLQNILGLLLLLSFFGGFSELSMPNVEITPQKGEEYARIKDSAMEEVIRRSEEDLAEKLCAEAERVFKVLPTDCSVEIETETMTLKRIVLVFSLDDRFISGYEVKKHFTESYGAETEVMIEWVE